MPLKNSTFAYGLIAKLFHWITALIILGMLSVGFYMAEMEVSPKKFQLYWIHKSFGILILILVAARIVWRMINPKPQDLPTHKIWERFLAHGTHIMLYLLIIAIPLTGWLMSSAGDFPAEFFGLFSLPAIAPKNETLFYLFRESHEIFAFIILSLIALHVTGAFKHHFLDCDVTLKRMTANILGFKGGAILACLAALLILSPVIILFKMAQKPAENTASQTASEPLTSETGKNTYAATPWTIDIGKSGIDLTATQYGENFSGHFKIAAGGIFFDPDRLGDSHVTIDIDIASLKTGSADRDTQARSPDWFDAAQFPNARFTAGKFEKIDATHFVAHGLLTLRGLQKPLDLPFTLNVKGHTALMNAELQLNRLDFGVGRGEWEKTDVIGNAVKLKISVTAKKNP